MMRRRLFAKLLWEKNVRTDEGFYDSRNGICSIHIISFYDWKLGPFLKEFSWQKNDKKAHFIQYYILLESLCDLSIFCNRAKWQSIRITSTYISAVLYSPSIFWSNFPDISLRICSSIRLNMISITDDFRRKCSAQPVKHPK